MNPQFETERLVLKTTTLEDAAFYLRLLNTPKWIKFIGDRNVHSIEDARAYIKIKMFPQLETHGFTNFTVFRKSDQLRIGSCGLYTREGLDNFDIGFAFLPEYERQGYGYESAHKLMEVARDSWGVADVSAITVVDNIASQKLIEKLGLQYDKMIKLPDDKEELMLYSMKLN